MNPRNSQPSQEEEEGAARCRRRWNRSSSTSISCSTRSISSLLSRCICTTSIRGGTTTAAFRNEGRELLEQGNVAYESGRIHVAINLHLEAALHYLKPQSLDQAECLDRLGEDYWRIGDLEQALVYSKQALAIKEQKVPESASLAKTLSTIGSIFHERRDYGKAYNLRSRSHTILAKLEPRSLDVAVASTNLGLTLQQLGRRTEARERHEQARRIKERLAPGSLTLVRTYLNLASLCSADDYVQAAALLVQAKRIAQTLSSPPAPTSLLVSLEFGLANIFGKSGQWPTAIRCYEQAIALEEEAVAPDSLTLDHLYTGLARAYEQVDDEQQAEACRAQRKALPLYHSKASVLL